MKCLLVNLLLLLIGIQLATSQELPGDLSGKWTGVSSFVNEKYQHVMELEHEGSLLSGVISWSTLNKKKHGKYEFNGIIEDNQIQIKALKFIEKKGVSCLPSIKMALAQSNNQYSLIGKWGSNNVKGGCLFGIGGKIEFQKSIDQESAIPISKEITKTKLDDFSLDAIKRLKSRTYHALFIGVESYIDESINDLDNPINDSQLLLSTLTTNYTFDKINAISLKNPTRTQIIETFDLLAKKVKSTDNLLIFYAGHGIWDEQLEQGYWLPSDAKKESKGQWLSNGTIRDYVRAIRAKHTILIADACFSGGILKQRNAFNTTKAMVEMYKLPSRKAMTSGTLKTVPDKSVFLEYLVKNLNNNSDPILSSNQLFAAFRIAVIHNSPNNQVPQYGVIHGSGDQGGDFLFLKR